MATGNFLGGLMSGVQQGAGLYNALQDRKMKQEMQDAQLAEMQDKVDLSTLDKSIPKGFSVPRSKAAEFLLGRQNKQAAIDAKGLEHNIAYANQFRDEFNQLSKPFQTIVPMYGNIKKSAMAENPTAASDMGLIFAYMKILDPNSTVREGEYATAQNAGSVGDAVMNQYNRLLKGEKLQPEQRINFANAAKKAFSSAYDIQKQHMGRYEQLAKRRGVDPMDVVYDYAGDFSKDLSGPDFSVPVKAAPRVAMTQPQHPAPFDAKSELARIRQIRGVNVAEQP